MPEARKRLTTIFISSPLQSDARPGRKPHHPLSPSVLHHRSGGDAGDCELAEKPSKSALLETEFHIVGIFEDFFSLRKACEPVKILLERQPAGKGNVDPIVLIGAPARNKFS